jgi:hypothetical protein
MADQNERLRELDAAKDDFLRGVSHNLQTPLARIRAYADQLAAEAPDRRLGIIAEQSDRLSRMVRQLLTVSRLDSGVLRPVAEVFALGPCVRRAWEALGASGVPFTLDDRAGGWLAIADPDQVDQVIWGLLDNAVKYGGGTPITVSVALVSGAGGAAGGLARAEGRAAGGGTLRLRIADGGPGIAHADRGRLFERYARGTEPGAEGTGLGLYVWCWIAQNRARAISRQAEWSGRPDRRPRPAPHSRSRSRRSPPRRAECAIRSRHGNRCGLTFRHPDRPTGPGSLTPRSSLSRALPGARAGRGTDPDRPICPSPNGPGETTRKPPVARAIENAAYVLAPLKIGTAPGQPRMALDGYRSVGSSHRADARHRRHHPGRPRPRPGRVAPRSDPRPRQPVTRRLRTRRRAHEESRDVRRGSLLPSGPRVDALLDQLDRDRSLAADDLLAGDDGAGCDVVEEPTLQATKEAGSIGHRHERMPWRARTLGNV